MKTTDIKAFSSALKDAVGNWMEAQIDALLPGKATMRVLAKNGMHNLLDRYADKVDEAGEMLLMLAGNNGEINTDTMVDMLASLLDEMDVTEFSRGLVGVTAGQGEVRIQLPRHFLLDMLIGGKDAVRFTRDDILQLKDFFKTKKT